MTGFHSNNSVKKYEELALENKPTLILSAELLSQISFGHALVGSKEWSGFLLYKIIEGGFEDINKMVLKAFKFYPFNIGSGTYTDFNTGANVMEMWETYPDAKNHMTGMIHTHHNMGTFFSGTDMQELHDNTDNYPFYLSLIVNFSGEFKAKIATISEIDAPDYQKSLKLKDTLNVPQNTLSLGNVKGGNKKVLVHMDCNIVWEIGEKFKEQFRKLNTPKVVNYNTYSNGNTQNGGLLYKGKSKTLPMTAAHFQAVGDAIVKVCTVDLTGRKILDTPWPVLDKLEKEYLSKNIKTREKFLNKIEDNYIQIITNMFAVKVNDELTADEIEYITGALVSRLEQQVYEKLNVAKDIARMLKVYTMTNLKDTSPQAQMNFPGDNTDKNKGANHYNGLNRGTDGWYE